MLCLCLREKATLMTGPSKLKGSSGGGVSSMTFLGWPEGHLTCSPLPISDQVCLQFCYSIISRLYTKTPSLIPGYLRTRNSFTPLVNIYITSPRLKPSDFYMLAPLNFLKTLPFMAAHAFIPLSPNIHIQILQTDLYIFS